MLVINNELDQYNIIWRKKLTDFYVRKSGSGLVSGSRAQFRSGAGFGSGINNPDPVPAWSTHSGFDQIRIHNTESINISWSYKVPFPVTYCSPFTLLRPSSFTLFQILLNLFFCALVSLTAALGLFLSVSSYCIFFLSWLSTLFSLQYCTPSSSSGVIFTYLNNLFLSKEARPKSW